MNVKQKLYIAKAAAVEAFFPWNTCLLCGKTGCLEHCLCSECSRKLAALDRCAVCGCFFAFKSASAEPRLCSACANEPKNYIDAFYSALPYVGYPRQYILALKYRDKRAYAKPLGKCLAAALQKENVVADYVAAVPLHSNRLAERGYNQAELLAETTAGFLGIKYLPDVLKRHKETKVQHKLSFAERKDNLTRAFSPGRHGGKIKGKTVLLIDDIMTSGSTVMNCAVVLKELGAAKVYAAAVASHLER